MGRTSTSYQKGQSGNPFGRPPGAENVLSKGLRNKFHEGMDERLETFWKHLDSLKGSEYVKHYIRAMDFYLPRLRSQYIEADINGINEATAGHIITTILKKQLEDGKSVKYGKGDKAASGDDS